MKCSKCDGIAKARGLCKFHYRIWHKENMPQSPSRTKEALRAYAAKYHAEHKEQERAYRVANKDRLAANGRAWRDANPERCSALGRAWIERNKERASAVRKSWKKANPQKVKAYKAKSRALNPEKWKRWGQEWRAKRPGIKAIYQQNRLAKLRRNGGVLSSDIRERLMENQRGICIACHRKLSQKTAHLDHVMPIALGGANEDWNVQLLCAPCNRKKHAKHPVDFMQERGFLL